MEKNIHVSVFGEVVSWAVEEDELKFIEMGVVPKRFYDTEYYGIRKTGAERYSLFLRNPTELTAFEKKNISSVEQEKVCPQDTPPDAYSDLRRVLDMAFAQASQGKGKERHANGREFDRQPIMELARMHGLGYPTGQAAKKLQEAHTLLRLRGKEAAIQEILGAINYAAAAVLLIEEMEI